MKSSHLKRLNFFASIIPSIARSNIGGYLQRFWLVACLFLFAPMLLACGQEESGTSGYRANLVFPEDIQRLEETSNIDCLEAGITTIVVNFIADGLQHGPYEFACEEHSALITGVPAGTGITVEVFADDNDGNAVLEGFEVVDIPNGQVVTGGTILMEHVPVDPITDTDTDTDTKNFVGTWEITDSPEYVPLICRPYIREVTYKSVITRNGNYYTITTTTSNCPVPVVAESCMVSDGQLSCPGFPYEDNDGRTHRYTEYSLTHEVNDELNGNASWNILSHEMASLCNGTSSLVGVRHESDSGTEE